MNAEVNVMSVLIRKFPDKKIFYDEYQVLKRDETICRELYNSADRDGIDTGTEWKGRKAWLEMQGFVFSNVERDMERVPIQSDECHFEKLESLVEFAYSKCALLGEIIVPEELSEAFSEKGKELFNRFLSENRQQNLLNPYEKKLLVFHIVQTIRDWNEDEDESDLQFWKRLFSLSSALCYDPEKGKSEKISLKEHALRIRALCYLGVSELPYESESAYPCYCGTLEFYDGKSGFWRAFNTDLNDSIFEPINPVNIWIIGEKECVLYPQNYDDASIIIDPKYGSIRNKRESALNPMDRKRGKLPDSFNYTVEVE